jgi:acetyl-CoA synthetase
MRRVMRKIVDGEADQLGDLSTLADPSVVEQIKEQVAKAPRK